MIILKTCIRWTLALWLCVGVQACSDDKEVWVAPDDPASTVPTGDACLLLNFRLGGESHSRAGRPEGEEALSNAVAIENNIRKLDVYLQQEGEREWLRHVTLDDIRWEEGTTSAVKQVRIQLDVSLEKVNVYVAANLTRDQAVRFSPANVAYTLPGDDGYGMVKYLAPVGVGTDGRPLDGQASGNSREGIAMCCTEARSPRKVEGGGAREYAVTFDLQRLVAKVLVTCTAEPPVNGVEYVPLKSREDGGRLNGWIRRSDVYYTINSLNRKMFLKQRVKEEVGYDANVEDPNAFLDGYLSHSPDYSDFYYLDIQEQYSHLELFHPVLLFEQDRLDEKRGKLYFEGLYCPENTFFIDNLTADQRTTLAQVSTVWPMITHVAIAAKFTPSLLYIEYELLAYLLAEGKKLGMTDEAYAAYEVFYWNVEKAIDASDNPDPAPDDIVAVECPNEALSWALLTGSLAKEAYLKDEADGHAHGFPQQTFFYYDQGSEDDGFYTYGAVKVRLGKVLGDPADNVVNTYNYVPHTQGWGYYYTYVDNRLDSGAPKGAAYEHAQVERNRYYILKINSFSHPGASISDARYIEVHTVKDGWKHGGSGDIGLN